MATYPREHSIGPSTISFQFSGDAVVMEGVPFVGNVDGVGRVDDRLRIALSGADLRGVGATTSASASTSGNGEWASGTYLESGDRLSGIAQKVCGDSSSRTRIFQANQPMLTDPDKIYPGPVLRIPA